jgi:hypothetical protein
MPRDGHRHALRDTRAHHVPGGGAAQVVEQLVGDSGGLGGCRRCCAPTFQAPWPEFSTQSLPCRLYIHRR